jgi:ribosome-associated translation inhibitor RaiA|tara:strand:+ start:522 stop:917 length:396 start_codon:yes stop_codon:yes gene_type:complete
MKYKDILGFSKPKKKIIKEQSKPKLNKIVESIKKELNESSVAVGIQTLRDNPPFKNKLQEVGSAPQHKKMLKNIEKAEENLHKHVLKYKNFLQSQNLNDEANEFSSKYVGFVGKFTHYTKTTWVKMLRKMI